MDEGSDDKGLQNPLTREGAEAEPLDTNEVADDHARVADPDGSIIDERRQGAHERPGPQADG